jgi:hypothetical protein
MMLPSADLSASNGGGSTNGLAALPDFLGRKSKYVRMDDVLPPEQEGEDGGVRVRERQSSRRYVFACSVFASLNSVLLGYGKFPLLDFGIDSKVVEEENFDLDLAFRKSFLSIDCA